MMTDQLIDFNRQGLIPGPDEDEPTFLDRANRCLRLKQTIITELKDNTPFVQDELGSELVEQEAFSTTQTLYDIKPSWVPIFFSNRQLMPWHGGCAWIFQMKRESPPLAVLQLRRNFARQDCFLGYRRDELMAHEYSHVGRMAYQEPRYEEILAYRSSPSTFRRFFGPLFQNSYETLILMGLFLLCLAVDLVAMTQGSPQTLISAQTWKLLPLAYICYLLIRLVWRHRTFKSCRKKLCDTLKNSQFADAVIYRLTDSEIEHISRKSAEELLEFARESANQSVRWQVIHNAYFSFFA